MALRDFRIDEATWAAATPMRHAEWRAAIDDLRSAELSPRFANRYALLTAGSTTMRLDFLDDEGDVRETLNVPLAVLDPHVKEYLAIIRRLDEGAGHRAASWIEAVDMAKKVVHDSAGRALAETVPHFSDDLEAHRRLFTMLLALIVDTTQLVHARGHAGRE
jgi:uncharacterized protein (UPF0262 family)